MSSAPVDGPGDGRDVDQAWADIVRHWDEPAPDRSTTPADHQRATASDPPVPEAPTEAAPHPADTPPSPAPQPDDSNDPDDTFAPADPGRWSALVTWRGALVAALVAGPPVVLLVLALLGHTFSEAQLVGLGLCFVAGMLLLIWQLRGPDDGPPPDDGAVV